MLINCYTYYSPKNEFEPIVSDNIEKHQKAKLFLSNLKDNIIISTQVINEFCNVFCKYNVDYVKIKEFINSILKEVELKTLSFETILIALDIKKKYNYSYYDSLVISAALNNGCNFLYSEDLQANQIIEGKLKIINPINIQLPIVS